MLQQTAAFVYSYSENWFQYKTNKHEGKVKMESQVRTGGGNNMAALKVKGSDMRRF